MNLLNLIKHGLHEANQSQHHHKLGAIIFRQGKILSRGFNRTNRGVSLFGKAYWCGSLHAEIAAIIGAKTDLSGTSILVVRRNLRLARPCPSCYAAIVEAGIKNLFYSDQQVIIKERL